MDQLNQIKLKGELIQYSVKYTKRKKTVGFTIRAGNHLIIHSPHGYSKEYIERLIEKKSNWILKHFARNEQNLSRDTLLFLGKSIRVYKGSPIRDNESCLPYFSGERLFIPGGCGSVYDRIRQFYKKEAQRIIGERVKYFSSIMKLYPRKVCIKDNKSNWGTCTPKKTLNFTYRIIMAPPEILDYIVVHELAHLINMNHSPRFWETVHRYIPEYKEKRKWLRDNEPRLTL